MSKTYTVSIAAALLIIVGLDSGCGGSKKESSSSATATSTGTTTGPGAAPGVDATVPLALKLYTKFDGYETTNSLEFTETGTTVCEASDADSNVDCTVVVPEGRLYFSSLIFQFSWMTSECKLLSFRPYYYMASTSATYTPPGQSSEIDCSVAPIPASCYGGAAPTLVPGFPDYTGLIYLPDESISGGPQSTTETLVSAFSQNYLSNRHTVNDLDSAKVGNSYTSVQLGSIGDGYIANSMVNYTFTCRDSWYDPEPYVINLYITDEDSDTGGPTNNFLTWADAP